MAMHFEWADNVDDELLMMNFLKDWAFAVFIILFWEFSKWVFHKI